MRKVQVTPLPGEVCFVCNGSPPCAAYGWSGDRSPEKPKTLPLSTS